MSYLNDDPLTEEELEIIARQEERANHYVDQGLMTDEEFAAIADQRILEDDLPIVGMEQFLLYSGRQDRAWEYRQKESSQYKMMTGAFKIKVDPKGHFTISPKLGKELEKRIENSYRIKPEHGTLVCMSCLMNLKPGDMFKMYICKNPWDINGYIPDNFIWEKVWERINPISQRTDENRDNWDTHKLLLHCPFTDSYMTKGLDSSYPAVIVPYSFNTNFWNEEDPAYTGFPHHYIYFKLDNVEGSEPNDIYPFIRDRMDCLYHFTGLQDNVELFCSWIFDKRKLASYGNPGVEPHMGARHERRYHIERNRYRRNHHTRKSANRQGV